MKFHFFMRALSGGDTEHVMATLMNAFVELSYQVYLAQGGLKVTDSTLTSYDID